METNIPSRLDRRRTDGVLARRMDMETGDAEKAFDAIYRAVMGIIGLDMTITATGRGPGDFDEDKPDECIRCLLLPLKGMLGESTLNRMVRTALEEEFMPEFVDLVMKELGLE